MHTAVCRRAGGQVARGLEGFATGLNAVDERNMKLMGQVSFGYKAEI